MQNIHHLRVMSKRRKRIILLACGIFAIGLIWALLAPREDEPSYQGRTVSQWLNDIDQGRWGAWNEAPIHAIGTNAIPACLKWISYEGGVPLRNRIAKLVERVSPALGRRLTVNHWGRSNRVVEVFRILGPQARAAIPELTRLAQTAIPARADGSQPGRAGRCINCLGFIGPDALPSILSLVTNSPPLTRCFAIWKLADFGTNAVAAVPALRLALTDTDPYVTNAASKALLKIAPEVLTTAPPQ